VALPSLPRDTDESPIEQPGEMVTARLSRDARLGGELSCRVCTAVEKSREEGGTRRVGQKGSNGTHAWKGCHETQSTRGLKLNASAWRET
jgi:hypothetical protein